MSTRIQALIADLRLAAAASRISKRQLALRSGLHINTLRLFRSLAWSPTVETLARLEGVLLPELRGGPHAGADSTSRCEVSP